MSLITPTAPVTPEELLSLPDSKAFELVGGNLVERHMGLESSRIAARIIFLILLFLEDRKLGEVFGSDASYQCFPHAPKDVRKPDVSFIRGERFPGGRLPEGHCRIAPDLAVEVISPGDIAYEIDEKVSDYLKAGVRLIWVVYPFLQRVTVFRGTPSSLGAGSELFAGDQITGEDVLPGFSCAVAQFFE